MEGWQDREGFPGNWNAERTQGPALVPAAESHREPEAPLPMLEGHLGRSTTVHPPCSEPTREVVTA